MRHTIFLWCGGVDGCLSYPIPTRHFFYTLQSSPLMSKCPLISGERYPPWQKKIWGQRKALCLLLARSFLKSTDPLVANGMPVALREAQVKGEWLSKEKIFPPWTSQPWMMDGLGLGPPAVLWPKKENQESQIFQPRCHGANKQCVSKSCIWTLLFLIVIRHLPALRFPPVCWETRSKYTRQHGLYSSQ